MQRVFRILGGVLLAGLLVLVLAASGAGSSADVVAVIVISGAVFAGLAYTYVRFVTELNEGTNPRTEDASRDREVQRVIDQREE